MSLIRLVLIIISFLMFLSQYAYCADGYRINNIFIDNSDRLIYIQGKGNFKAPKTSTYVPIPNAQGQNQSSVNLINNITTYKMTNPARYVIDIPNAVLSGAGRTYNMKNSIIKSFVISQFSLNPDIVRTVINLEKDSDLSKFNVYSNGENIIIKYNKNIIDNSIQYKFYTPSGDMDKANLPQNTSAIFGYNNTDESWELIPRLQNKYYLSEVGQNSDGLILRGLGEISLQRVNYSDDNTKATLVLDSTTLSSKLENKSYIIPSSNSNSNASLTIEKINAKKVKLTLLGQGLRDYRFVVSPDGQSLFISHRSYVINTRFSSSLASVNSYKTSKTSTGYRLIEFNFNSPVTYDVFELNNNFYLDINNIANFNEALFRQIFKDTDFKPEILKISSDKVRYIIPMEYLNFAYANVESNAKSIKLCFKEKPVIKNTDTIIIADVKTKEQEAEKDIKKPVEIKEDKKSENLNVIYIPKEEDNKKQKIEKPKKEKKKENPTIKAMQRVVLDPGHGGADYGAVGGGYYEKNINLEVAKLVQEKLAKKDIYVYMTRTKDTTLTLEDRVNYSNEISPDIYVSIHTNSTLQEDSYGLETHYYKDDSLELANTIHANFASEKNLKKWETKDRGVIKSRFYVINHTEAPSVLIEIGFISNLAERAKLLTGKRQDEIAEAIVKGILEYLKVK